VIHDKNDLTRQYEMNEYKNVTITTHEWSTTSYSDCFAILCLLRLVFTCYMLKVKDDICVSGVSLEKNRNQSSRNASYAMQRSAWFCLVLDFGFC
jgi:hypothetical protein